MALSSPGHTVLIPRPLADRIDQMVLAGEFAGFAEAVIALVELGLLQHDQRGMATPMGPSPPPPGTKLPPPGPPGP